MDEPVWASYTQACLNNADVLRDVAVVMAGASTALVHESGRQLVANFDRPVMFVWCAEDRTFPVSHAYRYAAELRQATVVLVEDSFSFTPEDNPAALASAISELVRAG